MKRLFFIIMLALIFTLTSCSNIDRELKNLSYYQAKEVDSTDFLKVKGSINKTWKLSQYFQNSIVNFSYESASKILFNENKMYSPISLYMALSMLSQIAGSSTRAEILKVLNINSIEDLQKINYDLYNILNFSNQIGKLHIANSIWLNQNYLYNQQTLKTLVEKYYASSFSVNYASPKTKKIMGNWVSKNTNDKLDVDFNNIDPATIITLLNVVYFYDQWINSFDKNYNHKGDFYSENIEEVEYMNQSQHSGYFKGLKYASASLSFKNGTSITFVLPNEGIDINLILKDPKTLKKSFSTLNNKSALIHYKIPKFSYKTDLYLNEIVKELGIIKAFGHDADFSSLADGNIFVSNIIQKSSISLDEKGCEATAYSSIMLTTSVQPSSSVFYFTLNRPFIYAIKYNNIPLFIGVVNNPS